MFHNTTRRRTFKRTVTIALLVLTVVFFSVKGSFPRHQLQPALFNSDFASASANSADVARLCHEHGFSPYQSDGPKRKVFDLFLMSTELEWLEIRLNTLYPYVDYFVIVESTRTFTGLPKTLDFANHYFSALRQSSQSTLLISPAQTLLPGLSQPHTHH